MWISEAGTLYSFVISMSRKLSVYNIPSFFRELKQQLRERGLDPPNTG